MLEKLDFDTLSIIEASKLLNMDKKILQSWIRTGRCPFGEYFVRGDSSRGYYLIFKARLEDYFAPKNHCPHCPYAQYNERLSPPSPHKQRI